MQQNQLVRDKVPEILEKKGKKVEFHKASSREYKKKLVEKLKDEFKEYLKDGSPEELVDLLEVVYTISESQGVSRQKLEKIRKEKALDRGSFEEGIILESVKD